MYYPDDPEVAKIAPHQGSRLKRGIGCVRFFDQVKAYSPGHVVSATDVRAMISVLDIEKNVSKGVITTTASFAPGIYKDTDILRFMPHRLELRPREALFEWLRAVRGC